MARLVIIVNLFILLSCNEQKDIDVKHSVVDSTFIPVDSTKLYFPQKPYHSGRDNSFDVVALSPFINKWFSKHLYNLGEPVLINYPVESEVYRFTWLRSFHPPVVVRVEHVENVSFISAKMSDGAGGYETGKITKDSSFVLSKSKWKKLREKLEELDFWRLSTADLDLKRQGMDGARWILEGKQGRQYHFVHRWSPTEKQYEKFTAVCNYLLSLAKFTEAEIPPDDVY